MTSLFFGSLSESYIFMRWFGFSYRTNTQDLWISPYLHRDPGWNEHSERGPGVACTAQSVPIQRFLGTEGLKAGTAPADRKVEREERILYFLPHSLIKHKQSGYWCFMKIKNCILMGCLISISQTFKGLISSKTLLAANPGSNLLLSLHKGFQANTPTLLCVLV